MTKLLLILAAQLLVIVAVASTGDGEGFARTMDQKQLNLHKNQTLTHLRFYWQESLKGRNPSAIVIAHPVSNTTGFGKVIIMDDPLTTDVSKNSTTVGYTQGIYAGASQEEAGFLMVMNFAFKTGIYNGSTISILGRNPIFSKIREMPVVGGSGMFRFARGYVEAQTKFANLTSGKATIEYNCYVFHY